jgi:hypothetical protein
MTELEMSFREQQDPNRQASDTWFISPGNGRINQRA